MSFTDQFYKILDKDDLKDLEGDVKNIEVISTGSFTLDACLGIGGIPKGRWSQVWGPQSSFKSTLADCISKEELKAGGRVIYIDIETQAHPPYIEKITGYKLETNPKNFDNSNFILVQPKNAEEALVIAEAAIESNEFGLIVFDSVGALSPLKEMEDDFTDANVALVPRLMSKFLRRNSPRLSKSNTAFLFINQVRDTIGSYVKSYTTPGGKALAHYLTVNIQLSAGQDITANKEKIGSQVKFTIKKNKMARPERSNVIPFVYGVGVDTYRDIFLFISTLGIVKKSGAYYKFDDINLGKGFEGVKSHLIDNPETLDKIRQRVYNLMANGKSELESEEDYQEDEE